MILHRQILEQHRLLVSMGRSFPKVSKLFYHLGPLSAYALVAGWVERQQKAGKIGAGDPVMMAELFLDMLTGKHQLALLTSSFDETSLADVARTVRAAANISMARGLIWPGALMRFKPELRLPQELGFWRMNQKRYSSLTIQHYPRL